MRSAHAPAVFQAAPAVKPAVVIQHSNAALVTCEADLRGALSVTDEAYIVAPSGVSAGEIMVALNDGGHRKCCYVAAEALGGLLVATELHAGGIGVALVIDPVTDETLARYDRGDHIGGCGPGPIDALLCAMEMAREILTERGGGDDE